MAHPKALVKKTKNKKKQLQASSATVWVVVYSDWWKYVLLLFWILSCIFNLISVFSAQACVFKNQITCLIVQFSDSEYHYYTSNFQSQATKQNK